MAREKKSQEWLADLCQEPDECEGRRPPCSVAVTERPWRPLWDYKLYHFLTNKVSGNSGV